MDTLPPEIKLNIFNKLSIRDSIKCRQVCKDWLAIIDCLRYKSLNFCVSYHERSERKSYELFHNYDIDLWILNFEKFFRSVTIDPKFSRVKVMNAIVYESDVENLGIFINHFHKLEELSLRSVQKVEKMVLNLKFLQKVEFMYPSNEIKLETPSLTHLMTRTLSNFEICYPEQIKCLGVGNALNLTKFTNLEILIISTHYFDNTISQLTADLLNRLSKLKRVYVGSDLIKIPIDRNSELQVYYNGFRIYSDLFGTFNWTMEKAKTSDRLEWTSFIARNYSKSIDNNPYHFDLDYTRLLDEFDQNIPNGFFKKISKFYMVRIKNLEDEKKILKFLDSTKLRDVVIKNPTLSRSFLEQLSKFSFIKYLYIKIDEWPAFLDDFNFDFKNEEIELDFFIYCSLKSLRPVFEVLERAKSIKLRLNIYDDEFSGYFSSTLPISFEMAYILNDGCITTFCRMESFDFCFYLDRQVPSIVELEDKLRLFSIVEEYEAQKKIAENIRVKLYQNPTISIKF